MSAPTNTVAQTDGEPAKPRQPWEKAPHNHGKTVANGEVRFTSVSALELASRCLRRWWYAYRGGLKDGPSDATERGNAGHEEIARYLYTGERGHMSALALSGLHQLPPPGPDLLIETPIVPDLPDGSSGLAFAKLRIAGIPVIGAIDLCHARPENYGVQDIRDAIDEPGVLKICDHKFPGSLKNAKTPRALIETTQMAGYGIWAFETFPGLERVRLTHNYFPVKGLPRAPTILATRDELQETWNQVTPVAVSIKHAAREANPDLIDANTRDCKSYGKDCPAKRVCRAANNGSVSSLIGVTAAERLLPLRLRPPSAPPSPGEMLAMTTPTEPTNLIALLAAQRAAQTQPAPAPAPVQTTPPTLVMNAPVAPASPSPDVMAEIARLQAVEAAAAIPTAPAVIPAPTAPAAMPQFAQPAPVALPVPPQPVNPILTTLAEIEGCGMGLPSFGGAAAQAIAQAKGYQIDPSSLIGGYGEISQHVITDLAIVFQLPNELRNIQAQRAAAAATTPAAAPIAPVPVVEVPAPAVVEATPEKPKKPRASKKKTDAIPPVENGAPAAAGAVEQPAPLPAPAPAALPPPVAPQYDPVPLPEISVAALPEVVPVTLPAPVEPPVVTGPTLQPPGAINVYVDCAIEGLQTQSLWPLVDFLTATMTAEAKLTDGRPAGDFRCADPNGPLGFGKWRGFLAAMLRDCPSRGYLAPGNYHLNGAMGEVGGCVSETMRQIAIATGGAFIKGAR